MRNNYTQDDLILYIYNELSEMEAFNIQKAIAADYELHRQYHVLLQVIGSLDTLNYEPGASSVDIILEHSHHEEHFH